MNYNQLVELDDEFRGRGLRILAFPCNQFGAQEPGTPSEIKEFVEKYNVQFQMMAKIDVKGPETDPFYKLLKGEDAAEIKWNFFAKFLLKCSMAKCVVVRRDNTKPSDLRPLIEEMLATDGLPSLKDEL